LLNDPELILADEPTNLDPQTSAEVLEVLRKINGNGKQ
jgi:cell division transport system ATP-binding protein